MIFKIVEKNRTLAMMLVFSI